MSTVYFATLLGCRVYFATLSGRRVYFATLLGCRVYFATSRDQMVMEYGVAVISVAFILSVMTLSFAVLPVQFFKYVFTSRCSILELIYELTVFGLLKTLIIFLVAKH